MGYRHFKIAALVLATSIFLQGCNWLDFSGMFVADTNANNRFDQSMEWNASNPSFDQVVAKDSYILFGMSDSHLGPAENFDSLLQIAKDSGAVGVFMAGDLTMGHEEDFANFAQHLPHPDTLPTFKVAGNHDLYFDSWASYLNHVGSSTYSFTVTTPTASDLYICLDSGSGTLGAKQLAWLENLLESIRPNHRHCIVITHNNLFRIRHTSSTTPMVEELHVLMDLFTRHDVNLAITGHDHVQYDELFGTTRHLTLDALLDGGYLQVNVEGDSMAYHYRQL